MKKVSAVLFALLVAAAAVVTVFAAGVNENEQAVLDTLKESVTMDGKEMVFPDAYINQAENYFNTTELTADQASQITSIIDEGKAILASSGAANIQDLSKSDKSSLFGLLNNAMAVDSGSASYDNTTREVTLYDKDGTVLLKVVPTLVEKGTGEAVNSEGKVIDSGVIKTTGPSADYTPLIIGGAVLVLVVAIGLIFLINKRA